MPTYAKTHEQNRLCVCVICFGKTKEMRRVNETHKEIINNFLLTGYDSNDDRMPEALCGTCRKILSEYSKGNFTQAIQVHDYTVIGKSKRSLTRNTQICDCDLCQVARSLPTANFGQPVAPLRNKPGISSTKPTETGSGYHSYTNTTPFSPDRLKPSPITICSFCLSVRQVGKPHNCCGTKRIENLKELAEIAPNKADDKLVAAILKDKFHESNEVCLSSASGAQMVVTKSTATYDKKRSLISADDMSKIQIDLNLSTNQTTRLATHLRTATGNRKVVEVDMRNKLLAKNNALEHLFDVKTVDFFLKDGKEYTSDPKPTVFCNNLEALVEETLMERTCQLGEVDLKVGIDGGGGSLKMCLNVVKRNVVLCSSARSKYSDGIAARTMSDAGVKKLFIIAISPGVEENYSNILKLWTLLELHKEHFTRTKNITLSTDLKLANILLGLMSHGSNHPCSWCDIPRTQLMSEGVSRTISNLTSKFWCWYDKAEGNTSVAKHYGNVIHVPIVKGEPDAEVLDFLPPPELHLMMGTVNTLYKELLKVWPGAVEWAKRSYVEREAIHGGSFTGNSCHLLLSKVDILRSICPLECLRFVKVFQLFAEVVHSCFGSELKHDYAQKVNNFRNAYLELEVPVTPKIHAVFYHVPAFCNRNDSALGHWSEQASEAVHSDFEKTWTKYKVTRLHPSYSKCLHKAVVEYNSKHI